LVAKAPCIRVLLVDDHALFRQTLRSLLTPYPNLDLVGEASDGQEAVENVARLQPSVVLMDIHLHRMMDGIAATRLITSQNPGVAVLGLSCDTRDYVVSAMRQAGAFEVLGKEQTADEVYGAIQRASASMSDE
jgi:DNA-binding NarL/FixJ family response regulator